LRDTLKNTPQRFTEENLKRAAGIVHQKALADIISLVRNTDAVEARYRKAVGAYGEVGSGGAGAGVCGQTVILVTF